MNTARPNHERIGVPEKVGFGLGDFGSNVVFQMVMIYMAYFYTDVFGLSAASMATLFLVVRISDAVTDPVMGAICDRTSTRWGKFRPYLIWLSVPYAIMAVLAFTTPDVSSSQKLVWAYLTYGLLMVTYTAINIPYCALGGVITPDNKERLSLSSYRFFLATCAAILISSALPPMVEYLGKGNEQLGYQRGMEVFAIAAILSFAACFLLTKERVEQSVHSESSFLQDLRFLLRNDQWVIVAVINIVLLVALVIRGSSAIYYITWFAGRKDLMAAFLTTGTVSMGIGAAMASSLGKRIPHIRLFVLCQLVMFVSSSATYLLPAYNLSMIFLFFAITQFFAQMGVAVLWTMLADTVDYGEFKTGRRITALSFSGALFGIKLGVAAGGSLFAWMLAYWGYQEGGVESQTNETIGGILMLFTVIPGMLHLPLAALAGLFNLSSDRCREIRDVLDRRQQEAASP